MRITVRPYQKVPILALEEFYEVFEVVGFDQNSLGTFLATQAGEIAGEEAAKGKTIELVRKGM